MLFNSYNFILLFLPATFALFHALHNRGQHRLALASLAFASLVFYGWWSLEALMLLLVLMTANYAVVLLLLRRSEAVRHFRTLLLSIGITGNLAVLGYFKYANFFLENWTALTGSQAGLVSVALPLGLSFFIFQKIALIVDAFRGKVRHFDTLGYVLFVGFFPQLIAGPIVQHSEVMPQFARREAVPMVDIVQGITLFVIGLTKKVLLADTIAQFANATFDTAAAGNLPSSAEAWTAALAYALQLYFDFSGYSDMAIGLALLFGIRLPINFASPYKACSIIDFWRRWHMTLSRFLRDYLYIPLGGSRHGQVRRYLNLIVTMLLGGLWHGAGWTFVVWGALHALYLLINHAWHALRGWTGLTGPSNVLTRLIGWATTFIAVLVAWVFFRAPDLRAAVFMLQAMSGFGSAATPGRDLTYAIGAIAILLAIVWFAPNGATIVSYAFDETTRSGRRGAAWWRPSPAWAAICGLLLAGCLMSLTRVNEFLYFQF
jgi:alginate O-acetyltransferase complex protein AlgI